MLNCNGLGRGGTSKVKLGLLMLRKDLGFLQWEEEHDLYLLRLLLRVATTTRKQAGAQNEHSTLTGW